MKFNKQYNKDHETFLKKKSRALQGTEKVNYN